MYICMPFLKSVINYIRCDQSFQIITFTNKYKYKYK